MSKKKRLLIDHPYVGAIIETGLLFVGLPLIAGILCPIPYVLFGMTEEMAISVSLVPVTLLYLLIHRLRLRKEGYKGVFSFSKAENKDVYLGVLIIFAIDVIGILFTATFVEGGISKLVLPSVTTFLISLNAGVYEEVAFRAIPCSIMMKNQPDRRRMILCVIITSVLFGLSHISNMIGGANLQVSLFQAGSCVATGVFFAAIYLRTGSILIPMVFHFTHDILSLMMPSQCTGIMLQETITPLDLVSEGIFVAAEIIFAIYVLRKDKMEEIKETWATIWSES